LSKTRNQINNSFSDRDKYEITIKKLETTIQTLNVQINELKVQYNSS